MNLKTFAEAETLFQGGMVYCTFSDEDVAWFDIINFEEEIRQVRVSNKGFLRISCNCEYSGKKGEVCGGLCKHKIAVIKELS